MSTTRRRLLAGASGDDEATWPYIMFTSTSENTLSFAEVSNNAVDKVSHKPFIQYSYNGTDWNNFSYRGFSSQTLSFSKDKPVYMKGSGTGGTGGLGVTYDDNGNYLDAHLNFVFAGDGYVSCYGNVMALVTNIGTDDSLPDGCFESLFNGCAKLVKAPALPSMNLGADCYEYMFKGCTGLLTAPELPATTLYSSCYASMFYNCTSLKKAPALPATTLSSYCYTNMFNGCTALSEVPEVLPAETLAVQCYQSMFYGCTSLKKAPVLPALNLTTNCYSNMFTSCTSLSYVKALFVYFNGTATSLWLLDVSSAGTFVKNSALTSDNRGDSFIPEGWTIESIDVS